LGCTIFSSVMSARASLFLLVDDFLEYFSYDIQVGFNRAYRIEQVGDAIQDVPGITRIEYLDSTLAYRIRTDDSESEAITILAVPYDTHMFKPKMIEGRWLLPGDENAVVLNTGVIEKEPDIKVGNEIVLKIEGREMTWKVVGIFESLSILGLNAHVNYPYFARSVHRQPGQSGMVAASTHQHDADTQSAITKELETRLKDAGIRTTSTYTSSQMRSGITQYFDIITLLLSSMAMLVAAVGGLGLMGTMSINVLERTREIGVMRAIGASDGAVQQIIMTEGIFIGVLSWALGVLIALPVGKLFSDVIGMGFLQTSLRYAFSIQGALICLVGVIILAAAASFLPAQRAASLTVREILVYE
jgi:putative ABC transport system permease protein